MGETGRQRSAESGMNRMGKGENTAGEPTGWKENWFPFNSKTLFTALKPIRTPRRKQPSCRLMTQAAKQRWNVKMNYVSDKAIVTEERWIF